MGPMRTGGHSEGGPVQHDAATSRHVQQLMRSAMPYVVCGMHVAACRLQAACNQVVISVRSSHGQDADGVLEAMCDALLAAEPPPSAAAPRRTSENGSGHAAAGATASTGVLLGSGHADSDSAEDVHANLAR